MRSDVLVKNDVYREQQDAIWHIYCPRDEVSDRSGRHTKLERGRVDAPELHDCSLEYGLPDRNGVQACNLVTTSLDLCSVARIANVATSAGRISI